MLNTRKMPSSLQMPSVGAVVPMTPDGQIKMTTARGEGLYDEQTLAQANLAAPAALKFFQAGRSGRNDAQTNSPIPGRLPGSRFASLRGMRLHFLFVSATTTLTAAQNLANDLAIMARSVLSIKLDANSAWRVPFLDATGEIKKTFGVDGAGNALLIVESGLGYEIEDPELYIPLNGGRNYEVEWLFPNNPGNIADRTYTVKLELLGATANQVGRGY